MSAPAEIRRARCTRLFAIPLAIALASLLATRLVVAQAPEPTSRDLAEARARYERGMELAKKGVYEQAVAELERAYVLAPSFKILFNLGLAYDALNDRPHAVRALERYLESGGAHIPADNRAEAERRLARLRQSVGRLEVRSDTPGVQIAVDEIAVGVTPLPEPILLDAGRHKVVAMRDGGARATRVVTIAGDERVTIALDPRAEIPEPATLDEAEAAFERDEPALAERAATRAMQSGRLSRLDTVRAYRLIARAARDQNVARAAYVELLASEPTFEESAIDPTSRAAFREAQAFWRAQPGPARVEASAVVVPGGASLRITLRDPTRIAARVEVGHRYRAGAYATREVRPQEGALLVPLAAPPASAASMQYYATVYDAMGNTRLEAGTPDAPLEAPVTGAVSPAPLLARPVVWIGAALVVAGGVTATYFATRSSDPSLPPSQAVFTPTLLCGSRAACD